MNRGHERISRCEPGRSLPSAPRGPQSIPTFQCYLAAARGATASPTDLGMNSGPRFHSISESLIPERGQLGAGAGRIVHILTRIVHIMARTVRIMTRTVHILPRTVGRAAPPCPILVMALRIMAWPVGILARTVHGDAEIWRVRAEIWPAHDPWMKCERLTTGRVSAR
jgi:hypothetical protein